MPPVNCVSQPQSESGIFVGPLGTGGHSGPPFPAPLLSQEPLGRDVNREVCLSWDWATRLISRWDLGPATVAAHGPRRPAAQPRLAAAPLARSPPSLLLLLRSPSPKAGTSTTPPGQATVPGKL